MDERDLEPLLRLLEHQCRTGRRERPSRNQPARLMLAIIAAAIAGSLLGILLGAS